MTINVDIFQTPAEHALVDHSDLTGIRTIQIEFGGTLGTPGDFYSPSGEPPSSAVPGPIYPTLGLADFPIAMPAGVILYYAWSIMGAGGTFQVYLNGITAGPAGVLIPGTLTGGAPMPGPIPVTIGDFVGLQFVSGTAPVAGTFSFFIQG